MTRLSGPCPGPEGKAIRMDALARLRKSGQDWIGPVPLLDSTLDIIVRGRQDADGRLTILSPSGKSLGHAIPTGDNVYRLVIAISGPAQATVHLHAIMDVATGDLLIPAPTTP